MKNRSTTHEWRLIGIMYAVMLIGALLIVLIYGSTRVEAAETTEYKVVDARMQGDLHFARLEKPGCAVEIHRVLHTLLEGETQKVQVMNTSTGGSITVREMKSAHALGESHVEIIGPPKEALKCFPGPTDEMKETVNFLRGGLRIFQMQV